ncbi:MAG: putative cell surface protein (Leucine-rich repeat protein) precursor [Bacteroidetes bacterium]|nr:putative cell surface protein (Leucine-rich repeat protein) precursor [Bacteroidota bacterium]
MKKLSIIFILVLTSVSFSAKAYDFFAINNDGDTIYYNITSSSYPYTVEVTNTDSTSYADSIEIPSSVINNSINYSVTSVGNNAFMFCQSLTHITIPNSVTTIGNFAFSFCDSLNSISFGNAITSIGSCAFQSCRRLTSLIIPNSVINIGYGAFQMCYSLSSIIIPNSVTSIGDRAFYWCDSLVTINLGNSITKINDNTFGFCNSLSSIIIPNSVTSIGDYAFEGCSNLTSITIPNSVTSIGNGAFYSTPLISIVVKSTEPPIITNTTFNYNFPNTILFVPCGSVPLYQAANNWNNFNIITNEGITPTYIDALICQGSTYSFNGLNIDSAGVYTQVISSMDGCDSIYYRINLTYAESPTPKICMVTVDENNHNEIVWKRDEIVDYYNVYRQGNQIGQYDLLATVSYDSISYIDTSSNPEVKAYIYKISAIDSCNNESSLSYQHKTMHLTISQGIGNNWNLNWSPYQGILYSTYNIYRGQGDSLHSLEFIETISGDNTSYTDLNAPSGTIYYQIEILLNESCFPTKTYSSIRSNLVSNKNIGISDITNNELSIKLYPNPTNDKTILEINGLKEKADVLLYDIYGRIIRTYLFNNEQGKLEINVRDIAKGIYNLKVVNSNDNITRKLIVN